MKILFIPFFYYIQYPVFLPVIKYLLKRGIDAKIFYVPNFSEIDETDTYQEDRFIKDEVPFSKFRLVRFARAGSGLPKALLQLPQFFINKVRLGQWLVRNRPDVVVIGSHLGQMYIRQIQVCCQELNIPVVSVWVTSDRLEEKLGSVSLVAASLLGIRNVFEWSHYNQYMRGHHFAASGAELKQHMVSLGIPSDRIHVTGNPLYDEIHRYSEKPRDLDAKRIACEFNLNPLDRYLVYLSQAGGFHKENIEQLGAVFRSLPEGIKVIVKFHPRESETYMRFYRFAWNDDRFRFTQNTDLLRLLFYADTAVSGWSRTLETSLVLGTPCIALNFWNNEKYSFFSEEKFDLFMAKKPEELQQKLFLILFDENAKMVAEKTRVTWVSEKICCVDGKSTERLADLILSVKNSCKSASVV